METDTSFFKQIPGQKAQCQTGNTEIILAPTENKAADRDDCNEQIKQSLVDPFIEMIRYDSHKYSQDTSADHIGGIMDTKRKTGYRNGYDEGNRYIKDGTQEE